MQSHSSLTVGSTPLLDRRPGRASGERLPADREHEVETLDRTRCNGLTARHLHEHLFRDRRFNLGHTWTTSFPRPKLWRTKLNGWWSRTRLPRGDIANERRQSARITEPEAAPGCDQAVLSFLALSLRYLSTHFWAAR